MLDLIILVLISLIFACNCLAYEKLEEYFFDLDIVYFDFLEEENLKIKKQIEIERKQKFILETIKTKELIIKINIKNMIKIEQKIKNNNKLIKLYKNNKKTVKDKPSAFDVWKAEGLNIKYKKEWQEKYNHNKRLIAEINKLK